MRWAAAGDAGLSRLPVPFSLSRAGQLLPAGSVWLYVRVVGFAAIITNAGTLLPTWLQLRRRPLEAAVPA